MNPSMIRRTATEQRADAEVHAEAFLVSDAVLPSIALLLVNDWAYADLIASIQSPPLPPAVVEAVRSFVENGDVNGTADPDPHWYLIAQGLAIVATTGKPDVPRLLGCSKRLDNALPWVTEVWLDACAQRIASLDALARVDWTTTLGTSPSVISENNSSIASVVVSRVSARWEVADALQLWSERPVAFHEIATWPPSGVLYRIDRTLWFQELDQWSDPRLVQAALFYLGSRHQQQELLQFLGSARPCFSEHGKAAPASSAIVLCDAALRLAEDLHGSESPASATMFLARFVATLLERNDGAPLALALASRVFDRAILHGRTSHPSPSVAQMAWDCLRPALIEKSPSIKEHRQFFESRSATGSARRESARCELPALFVASATLTPGSNDNAHLAEWLRDALTRKDEWTRAELINIYFRETGKIYTLFNDPCGACRATFEGLERQRRHAEFGRSVLEHWLEVPSLLVLLALCSLVEQGHGADPEADLRYVCERAARIALTATGFDEPLFPAFEVVASAACVAIGRFGAEDPRAISLLREHAKQTQTMGFFVCKITKLLGPAGTSAVLGAVGLAPQTLAEELERWAAATRLPSDQQLAEAVAAAVAPPQSSPGNEGNEFTAQASRG